MAAPMSYVDDATPSTPATRSDCSAQSIRCASTPTAVTDLARIPGDGIDYGLLRYLRADNRLREHPEPQLLLNYLGSVHVGVGDLQLDRGLMAEVGRCRSPNWRCATN